MTMIKRGTFDTTVVVASSVYVCSACGHTEMLDGDVDSHKECPVCHAEMMTVCAQSGMAED